jgi:NTE family protein
VKLCCSQEDRPSVGLVLTGGGARGAAHVGVLLALEDSGIPIDYVVGTSVGALVGGYYASGWSPQFMWSMLSTEEFRCRVTGQPQQEFVFGSAPHSPSVFNIRLGTDRGDVRGHLISSLALDWGLMEELTPACAAAHSDFDSLMVPFRCVSSDVLAKKDTVFSGGNLAQSIRASMSFPFYMQPVWLDGRPFYDGGLYNNRPVDVMIEHFDPDIILVSGVESAAADFKSDDLISQLEALVVRYPEPDSSSRVFEIDIDLDVSTLDFDESTRACEAGYAQGLAFIDAHQSDLPRLNQLDAIVHKRTHFTDALPEFEVDQIQLQGLDLNQQRYAEQVLGFRGRNQNVDALKRGLFLLEADSYVGRVFPTAQESNGAFEVLLDATKERDLKLELGGNISSRGMSMGHAAVGLNRFTRLPFTLQLASTVGQLYTDFGAGIKFHVPAAIPVVFEPVFNFRRWNYTRELVGFLREIRPTFLTSAEMEWGGRLEISTGLRSALRVSLLGLKTTDKTYAEWLFSPEDLTNDDRFGGAQLGVIWMHKSLNHRQFPTHGHKVDLGGRYFSGDYASEFSPLGVVDTRNSDQSEVSFWRGFAQIQSFMSVTERWSVGLNVEGRVSNEKLRTTYRGSLAQAPVYDPMPGGRALFLENFRAFGYHAYGAITDLELIYGVHLRAEIHAFKATPGIDNADKGPRLIYDSPVFWMSGARVWKELPIGPISAGIEYYKSERSPLFFEVLLGYRLFQSSARR